MIYKYSNYIVVGSGSFTNLCAKFLKDSKFKVTLVESNFELNQKCNGFSSRNNIPYLSFNNRKELTNFLVSINYPTLIVSAANRYLFPQSVIKKINIDIINYHASILPKYPGRNSEAWAIFNGDTEGGISWHKVSKEVDAGELLDQCKVEINESTTSLSLLKKYNQLSLESFKESIKKISLNSLILTKQDFANRNNIYYSWMRPDDGILNLENDELKISRFLRSYDYGLFKNLGNFKVLNKENILSEAYEYAIHDKLDFRPKFKNSLTIEKETKIFEIVII
tara:strand:+ start:129 stop:971 length:843 start_codon:yes stop_codon:yes gene_type:complete